MYSYIPACCCRVVCCYTAVAATAAACCCCSSSYAGWQNFFPWFTASDSSVFSLFFQTRFFLSLPLGSTVAFSASIFLLIIHVIHPRYYGHARSQGGRSIFFCFPPWKSKLCKGRVMTMQYACEYNRTVFEIDRWRFSLIWKRIYYSFVY